MACGPERMECEAAIQAFEASMHYRLDSERCCSKATSLAAGVLSPSAGEQPLTIDEYLLHRPIFSPQRGRSRSTSSVECMYACIGLIVRNPSGSVSNASRRHACKVRVKTLSNPPMPTAGRHLDSRSLPLLSPLYPLATTHPAWSTCLSRRLGSELGTRSRRLLEDTSPLPIDAPDSIERDTCAADL